MARPSPNFTLGEAILGVAGWPNGSDLMLPFDRPWSIDCPCLVREGDRYAEADPILVADGIEYQLALQQEQVQSIVENARQQLGKSPSVEEALNALLFYYDNDAYIVFDDGI